MNRIILLLAGGLGIGCAQPIKDTESTFYPYLYLYELTDSSKLELSTLCDQLQFPVLPVLPQLDSSWYFELGDPAEGLETSLRHFNGDRVHLPHRIEFPNHPLWYRRKIDITQPGYLYVRADDGAQVYLGESKLEAIRGNFFFLDVNGIAEITIRVLNNAMLGGLQQVAYLSVDQYNDFQYAVMDYHVRKQLVRKVLLKRKVTQQLLDLAEKALRSGDSAHVNQLKLELEDCPYLMGPYLMMTGDSVRVMAIGEGSTMISLDWGPHPDSLLHHLSMPGPLANFSLGKLNNDATYYYRIKSAGTTMDVVPIARQDYGSFTFNVWADSQSGWKTFAQTIRSISKGDDAFGIGVGDLVANGSDSTQWIQFLSMLSQSAAQVPYYLIAGNHDYDGFYDRLIPQHYHWYTGNKTSYQSWEYGNVAFIALDPNDNFPIGIKHGSRQYDWFHQQIESEAWKRATWRFILLHQPPFSQGWAGYHGDQVVRDLLEPVLEKAKVDFVIAGHTHDYERVTKNYGNQRVTFLIVGGAGGTLEPIESSVEPQMDTVIKANHFGRFFIDGLKMRFEAIGHDGTTIDTYQQKKE